MLSWNEYLSSFVSKFRNKFEELNSEEKFVVPLNMTFLHPCQIEVIEFKERFWLIWVVTFDRNRPDMEYVHTTAKEPTKLITDRPEDYVLWKTILAMHAVLPEMDERRFIDWFSINENSSVYLFGNDPRIRDPECNLATELVKNIQHFSSVKLVWQLGYERIEKTTSVLKKEKGKIIEEKLPTRFLDITKIPTQELTSAQVKRFEQYEQKLSLVEQEIGGVRRLIGVSKEFQDWRLLASDVQSIKDNYINKSIFQTEMRRLDQRIDDLKAIRFWSKRTVIDILLAIAASIVTLIAAGIIRLPWW